MLFGETVAVYCENDTEHTDTLCGQNSGIRMSFSYNTLYREDSFVISSEYTTDDSKDHCGSRCISEQHISYESNNFNVIPLTEYEPVSIGLYSLGSMQIELIANCQLRVLPVTPYDSNTTSTVRSAAPSQPSHDPVLLFKIKGTFLACNTVQPGPALLQI
jgi:hypothetical protein